MKKELTPGARETSRSFPLISTNSHLVKINASTLDSLKNGKFQPFLSNPPRTFNTLSYTSTLTQHLYIYTELNGQNTSHFHISSPTLFMFIFLISNIYVFCHNILKLIFIRHIQIPKLSKFFTIYNSIFSEAALCLNRGTQ